MHGFEIERAPPKWKRIPTGEVCLFLFVPLPLRTSKGLSKGSGLHYLERELNSKQWGGRMFDLF